MSGKLIDPVTGKPFDGGPRVPVIPGPTPADVNPEPQAGPPPDQYVLGVAVYDEDGTFNKFVAVGEDGTLTESIVVEEGQILIMLHPVARAVPNPGTTIKKVGTG